VTSAFLTRRSVWQPLTVRQRVGERQAKRKKADVTKRRPNGTGELLSASAAVSAASACGLVEMLIYLPLASELRRLPPRSTAPYRGASHHRAHLSRHPARSSLSPHVICALCRAAMSRSGRTHATVAPRDVGFPAARSDFESLSASSETPWAARHVTASARQKVLAAAADQSRSVRADSKPRKTAGRRSVVRDAALPTLTAGMHPPRSMPSVEYIPPQLGASYSSRL